MSDVEDDEIEIDQLIYDNDYSYESDTYIEDEDNTLSKRMKLLSNFTSKNKEIISNNEPFAKNKIQNCKISIFLKKHLDQLVMQKRNIIKDYFKSTLTHNLSSNSKSSNQMH